VFKFLRDNGFEISYEEKLLGGKTPDLLIKDYNIFIECNNLSDDGIMSYQYRGSRDSKAEQDKITEIIFKKLEKFNDIRGVYISLKKIDFLKKDLKKLNKIKKTLLGNSDQIFCELIEGIKRIIALDNQKQDRHSYKNDLFQIEFTIAKVIISGSKAVFGRIKSGWVGESQQQLIKNVEEKYDKYENHLATDQKIIVGINVRYGFSLPDLTSNGNIFKNRPKLLAIIIFEGNYNYLNERGAKIKKIYTADLVNVKELELLKKLQEPPKLTKF